jgi:hypothetical protein
VRKLLPAQHQLTAAVPDEQARSLQTTLAAAGTKGRLVGNMSTGPRLTPARQPVCSTAYHDVVKSEAWIMSAYKVVSFAKDTSPQRPATRQSLTAQLSYDTPSSFGSGVTNPVPKSTSRRFVDPKVTTPPVGTYTSKFVSCGMIA